IRRLEDIYEAGVIMSFFKHIRLFIHIHLQQLKRKWLLLPLLLLFPLVIVGAIILLVASFFQFDEEMPLTIGVVDHDQSEETTMIVDLLEESTQFGHLLQVTALSENVAEQKSSHNELTTYITLPEDFSSDLYAGRSVKLSVTGNPQQETESHIIYELINSIMRHIQTAQANILLINEYAQKTTMDEKMRSELVMNEFMSSLMSILGREKIVSEQTVENIATSSTKTYFLLSAFFIIVTLWLFISYYFFYREEDFRMVQRLRSYGVTPFGQMIARILVTLLLSLLLFSLALIAFYKLPNITFYFEDIQRILLIYFLYSSSYLITLALFEVIFTDARFRLLIHALLTLLLIVLSGSLVPTIYFPLYIQDLLTYIPAYHALYWWQEILLNDRLYANYFPLLIFGCISLLIWVGLSLMKERVER